MPALSTVPADSIPAVGHTWRRLVYILLALAALPVVAILVWQGITSHGNPDPTTNTSRLSAILDIAVLVFREGLESILVLAAITAGLSRGKGDRATPIFLGASTGFIATLVTWFLVRGIVEDISVSVPYLKLQAATGLLAVIVLLVSADSGTAPGVVFWGLVLLGLTSVYREGFEVVLFLQSYYLKLGGMTVFYGSLAGLFLTLIVAVITFLAHQRVPYRKMLIVTGILLGIVLLVMVGEEAFEMQQANWLSTTNIASLKDSVPDWAGVWFSVYPTYETIAAQVLALVIVVGSYFIAGKFAGPAPEPETAS